MRGRDDCIGGNESIGKNIGVWIPAFAGMTTQDDLKNKLWRKQMDKIWHLKRFNFFTCLSQSDMVDFSKNAMEKRFKKKEKQSKMLNAFATN